jgi:hypothetical protein
MKNVKLVNIILGFGFLTGLSACFVPPNYPDTPEIGFGDIRNFPLRGQDSVVITISYRDGNGDLGYDDTDFVDPVNGQQNPNFNNYFVRPFKRQRGQYVPIRFTEPSFSIAGRFPRLIRDSDGRSIEGDLTYNFKFAYIFTNAYTPPVRVGDTLRFDVQINDRRLNMSNVVTTEDIVIGTRK